MKVEITQNKILTDYEKIKSCSKQIIVFKEVQEVEQVQDKKIDITFNENNIELNLYNALMMFHNINRNNRLNK